MTTARYIAALLALSAASPAMAQFTCDQKEYAQYKDETKSQSARMSLAFEHCRIARTIDYNNKMMTLATQHRKYREIEEARQNIAICESAQTKIVSALTAVNDDKNLKFLRTGCKA